jgi:hypothetical protein
MPRVAKGHIEQLPSGSFQVSVYAGTDPLTRRPIRLKATAKTEQQAYIELRRLLKEASEGRTFEANATMAKLLDEYAAIAPWDVSARQTNEGFIRRTIKPALGPMKVRRVRGPILDKLYAELKRCGDLSCTGRPFIEHRNVPVLVINPRGRRPAERPSGHRHRRYPARLRDTCRGRPDPRSPRTDPDRWLPRMAGRTLALAEETSLRRNTLRKVAFLHTVPPRWQQRSNSDEGRVARRVVDPSIGRSGQQVSKHPHGPVHLWSRLLSFESSTVLVDPGRDEEVRVE